MKTESMKEISTVTLKVCCELADNLSNGGVLLSTSGKRNVSAN